MKEEGLNCNFFKLISLLLSLSYLKVDMGSCFSKNTTTTTSTPPTTTTTTTSHQSNLNNDQPLVKKEIFVIKHRISHEEKTPNLLNPSSIADGNGGRVRSRTPSCSKEEVDEILIQCGRLSRSNSAGAQNPSRRRRSSRSKRSFDFDLNLGLKNVDNDDADNDNVEDEDEDEDEGLNHRNRRRRRQRQGSRVSSPSSRRSSGERDFRQPRSAGGGGGGGRRISISPSRRSESPICRNNGGPGAAVVAAGAVAANGGSGSRPMKMVPVPATDKSSTAGGDDGGGLAVGGGVKRIHVKRNVAAAVSPPRSRSPGARTNLRIFSDDRSEERWRNEMNSRAVDRAPYKRKSLAEIDNNAARSVQPKMVAMVENLKLHEKNGTRTRISGLSRDLDMDQEPMFESDPSPPSYTSLLLEDINNFHRKNTNSAATTASPPFSLPACVSKACSIMEAVADLNSTTTATGSSFFSDDKWRKNPNPIDRYIDKERFIESETVVNGGLTRGGGGVTEEQESSGGNGFSSGQKPPSGEPKSADPATRKCEMKPLGGLQSKLLDYPRKGIGRGRKTAYPVPEITTVALT